MIKFVGGDANNPLLGFGLSFKNLKKLKQGMPILIDLKEMGLVGKVLIFAGSTEKEMQAQLKNFVTERTEVKDTSDGPKSHECAAPNCGVRLFDPKEEFCQHHEANRKFGVE